MITNYIKKCVISAIEADINNTDSYELGKLIGGRIKFLENGKAENANGEDFLRGVKDGIDNHNSSKSEIK